ncbi:sulfate ABC transporter permease [Vibrio sp. ZSDE26]|uniref:Sulfate ABC transporter permease n=1 Tax=Vibrio amylolyticus TaxID=2847292 RepID=A0A9X1XKE9_9VIBR|nr:sulfate ABC transporter permease [Vibrio amylolyticus]MCK6264572.1 sulfate ABC transporter permease [Vibrio amylolyticus]
MRLGLILLLLLYAPWATAQVNLTESIRLSGFGTVSATKSDTKTPIIGQREISDEWCFDCDSSFGIQLDADFTDHWRAAAQVVKRPQDEFSSPELEQAFVEYSNNNYQVKVGRLRLPLYMYSEVYYVSSAYPWLRLPIDVYSFDLGITHFDGARLDWNVDLSNEVQLIITPFYTSSSDSVQDLYGLESHIETGHSGGLSSQIYFNENEFKLTYIRTDLTLTAPQPIGMSQRNIDLFTLGMSYHLDLLHFQTEILFADDFDANWYAGFDYLLEDWQPYIQYGQQRSNLKSESYLIGTKYNITRQLNLNVEWQYIEGRQDMINGHFTELQMIPPYEDSAHVVSVGLSFTF